MEIRKYFAIAQRWYWLIALGIVLLGGTAYVVSAQSQPIYRASARLLIDQAPGSGGGNEYTQILVEQRLATTYVELIKLNPVMEETVRRLNLPFGANQLSAKLTVSAPPETQLIVLNVEDTEQARAALIANTVAQVFIDQNQARQNSRFQESILNWETRLDELREEITFLETAINGFGEPGSPAAEAELSGMETDLRQAEIRYTEAFNNLELLRVEEAKSTNNLVLVEPAHAPTAPIRPRPILNMIIGAISGAIIASALILLIEYLDDTVKSPEQIEQEVGISTLGAIANIKDSGGPKRLVTQHTPRDPVSEAYRVLRTNLNFSAVDGGLKSLLVTSSSPGEGKSTTIANLAIVMAQTGKRVVAVDSDLRRPMLHQLFELSNNRGLTTALLDHRAPVQRYLQNTLINNLQVLTSGPAPPNPAELLNSQRMGYIMQELQDVADIVLFDAPPALTVADATILASQVSGCIMVVQASKTRSPALVQAVDTLQKSNANVLGAVLNQVLVGRSAYYYYRYYHYDAQTAESSRFPLRLPQWLSGLSKR